MAKAKAEGILVVAENRKARHDYEILKVIEAGMVLTGSEVKSLRDRQMQLKDSYVSFRGHEAFLQNAHIAENRSSSYNNHAPERLRKLLLHYTELVQLAAKIQEKGLSLIPLRVYFKNNKAKVELALAKGRKNFDKREAIKKKDVEASLRREKRFSR